MEIKIKLIQDLLDNQVNTLIVKEKTDIENLDLLWDKVLNILNDMNLSEDKITKENLKQIFLLNEDFKLDNNGFITVIDSIEIYKKNELFYKFF